MGATLSYEDRFYEFRQEEPFEGYGESFKSQDLRKTTKLEDFQAKADVEFENSTLGTLRGFIGYTDYNYGYNSILELVDGRITNRLKGNLVQAGAQYEKTYRGFSILEVPSISRVISMAII